MSQLARRVYYLSAFLIFAVIAPLLLAWTSGYRWSNLRTGFVRTGALVVYSNPRAEVRINGKLQGSTPFRQTHLSTGTYTVTVSKSGYADWTHTVRITPNTAQVIGPVLLFHPTFTQIAKPLDMGETLLHDADNRVTLSSRDTSTGASVSIRWPVNDPTVFTLAAVPTSFVVSPNAQSYAFATATTLLVVQRKDPTRVWAVQPPTSMSWDTTSDAFFFGVENGSATRFDIGRQEQQVLTAADSLTIAGDTLWISRTSPTETTLLKLPAFGQTTPTAVGTLPGLWSFVPSSSGALIVRNANTNELSELRYANVSGTVTRVPFGIVDRLWWTDRSQPPVWLSGSDILTRDVDDQTVLIDRVSTTILNTAWIDSGHVLAVTDGQSVSIRSISSRQGRGTLLDAHFPSSIQLQSIDVSKKVALISITKDSSPQLVELHW